MQPTLIYTDGACKGNGKTHAAGGFGVFICYADGSTRHIWGGESPTTNNRMELLAAIVALQSTPQETVQIWTDSSYVKNGISQWLAGWKAKNWKKADGKAVLNQDLWQQLDALCQNRQIDWQWIKGHAGHDGNEMADKLANLGVTSQGNQYFPKNHPTTNTNYSSPSQQNNPKNPHNNRESLMNTSAHTPSTPQTPSYDGDTSRANPYFVPILPTPIHQGAAERQLIMDTETTGFEDQNGDRIVEVGMIELIGRKFTGEKLHVYLNPDKIMDEEVIKVHGISNEFLADKPHFEDVAAQIYHFIQGAELVAHNANFDMRFLNMEFKRAGLGGLDGHVSVLDTLALAKQMYPGQKNSLDALVKRLNVGKKDRTFHGALLDSEILAEVYLAMTGGQVALAIDEEESDTNQEIQAYDDLTYLAKTLTPSIKNEQADGEWRALVLK